MEFELSALEKLIEGPTVSLLPGYWITADAAYVCGSRILTPWPGKKLSKVKDCFNLWLSYTWVTIEQSFGVFVARWGFIWRPLKVSVMKCSQVVIVCSKLQKYIIESSNSTELLQAEGSDSNIGIEVNLQDEYTAQKGRRRDIEK